MAWVTGFIRTFPRDGRCFFSAGQSAFLNALLTLCGMRARLSDTDDRHIPKKGQLW
jgi:hypothetical protein